MVRQKRRKNNAAKRAMELLLMAVIAVLTYKSVVMPRLQNLGGGSPDSNASQVSPSIISSKPSDSISTGKLHSPNIILVSLDDNAIVMEKKSEEKIYPASLTKIMTVIVALENLPDLKKKITLQGSMFNKLFEENASMAGFLPNEKVSAIDLIYGAMLPSGAESCMGLAMEIAGSEKNFVKMMNQKAEEIGMNGTHFENSTGLHDKNHYTTVKDLAALLSYGLQNDTFRKIFTSSQHTVKATNKHPEGVTLRSTMFDSLGDPSFTGGEIIGGKTGFTDEAGLCLASLARKGGREYILITAGAGGNHKSEQYNITDALIVYNNLGKK